jgi:general secretion pathway protein C
MQVSGLTSLSLAPTALVWGVTLAAVAALGAAGAYWTWAWFAPRPQPVAQVPVPAVARLDAAYGLFGTRRASHAVAAPGGIRFRLLGAVAATGEEPGYALLSLDGKRVVAVREGGDIEPGTRLVEVNADHVVLDRGGMRETLAWPRQGKGAAAADRPATK